MERNEATSMTEAERLAQALDDARAAFPHLCWKLHMEAAAELRRLSADARRYAWLRLRGAKFPEPIGCMSELLLDEELDAAIDQAMKDTP